MELRRLSDLFWNVLPNSFFLSMITGVVTGIGNSLMIPFVMYSINTDVAEQMERAQRGLSFFDSPTEELAKAFLWVCLFLLVMKGLSSALSLYVAKRASVEHRLWLYRRIQNLRLADLERIGQSRLITLLNVDIPTITNAAVALPQIWINLITVLGMLGYLLHVNVRVFGFVLLCLVVAILSYQLPLMFANRFFKRAREGYDHVQQGVRGLIYGAKELKLNRAKANAYYEHELLEPEKIALKDIFKGNTLVVFTQSYGDVLSFLIVGIVIFHLRYTFMLTNYELLGLAMALLFLTSPVSQIMANLGNVQMGNVSLAKLQRFYNELQDETVSVLEPTSVDWTQMSVHDLSYTYNSGGRSFSINDVNLVFLRGQVTFIVGGNGSGKSTLGKCLAFLYNPGKGHIRIGERVIDESNIQTGRELVSAIFPDYFLFKRVYGEQDAQQQALICRYLKYLELDHKVSLVDGEFTTLDLSEGQRKRLALLATLMEDREICIFDEWAADQDPAFKEVFYSTILPDLREQNKVVIVISHDDRYFRHADQLVFMENGRVKSTETHPRSASRIFAVPA